MIVTVVYRDDKMGMVEVSQLDELISSSKIKQFLRSDGWVTIGIDPIRRSRNNYIGRDRRRQIQELSNLTLETESSSHEKVVGVIEEALSCRNGLKQTSDSDAVQEGMCWKVNTSLLLTSNENS